MFLRGKLCQVGQKKISSICYSFLLCLLSFFFALFFSFANASAWSPDNFNVYFNVQGGNYQWRPDGSELSLNDVTVVNAIRSYQWKRNSQAFSGNYATIHFETNIVFPNAANNHIVLRNLDDIFISYCGSSGSNGTVRSQSVSTYKTNWIGSTPYSSSDTFNQTLTIKGDVVLTGLPSSGTHDLYCGITTANSEPFAYNTTTPGGNTTYFYFEQQPTTVTFTNDSQVALLGQQINSINSVGDSVKEGNDAAQERWETERQEQSEKEQDLENSSGDLSLSATATSNPFLSLLINPQLTTCQNFNVLPQLFNSSSWRICSPYPLTVRYILNYINSLFVTSLLIRLYYKKLKGGVDG